MRKKTAWRYQGRWRHDFPEFGLAVGFSARRARSSQAVRHRSGGDWQWRYRWLMRFPKPAPGFLICSHQCYLPCRPFVKSGWPHEGLYPLRGRLAWKTPPGAQACNPRHPIRYKPGVRQAWSLRRPFAHLFRQ